MNFDVSFGGQVCIFIVSGLAIWYFCNKLSDVVEYINAEFGLGAAFGGTLILSIVTNLPEIAITVSGSIQGDYDLVTGNLLGGIAMQSLLLIMYDFASKDTKPLSNLTSSAEGKFQGLALVVILLTCFLGGTFKEKTTLLGAGISMWSVAVIWIGSLLYLKKVQSKAADKNVPFVDKYTKKSALWWLAGISIVVLFFGVLLENSSNAIADKFGLSGLFFGATVLALVTSIPEISSGLEFVKNKDYMPIISDIFGGNGFLPVLLLPASFIAGQNIISKAGEGNNFLSLLSTILTIIFLLGMQRKSNRKIGKLGWDTWLMLIVGLIGFAVLYRISS